MASPSAASPGLLVSYASLDAGFVHTDTTKGDLAPDFVIRVGDQNVNGGRKWEDYRWGFSLGDASTNRGEKGEKD